MPITWQNALNAYNYPVCLHTYNDAGTYPEWFRFGPPLDDRNSTMAFEGRFRQHAAANIEAWLEVVYWKLYSQQRGRSDRITTAVANRMPPVVLQRLNYACADYMANPSWRLLNGIRTALGFANPVVAVAATFPAFLNPFRFPMVDTRVARWVHMYGHVHNAHDQNGPQLVLPRYLNNGQVLTGRQDYPFVESWTQWCRYTAAKLSAKTSMAWRARDVEMAVFTAWGMPLLTLNPV